MLQLNAMFHSIKEHRSCHDLWHLMHVASLPSFAAQVTHHTLDRKFVHFPSCFLNTMNLQKQAKHTVYFLA
jgi:hypothetical protein